MAARRRTGRRDRLASRGGTLTALVALLACVLYAVLPVVQSAHSHAAHGHDPASEPAAAIHACSHGGHHEHGPSEPAEEPRPVQDHDDCRICLALKLARTSGTPEMSAPGLVALLPALPGPIAAADVLPAPAPSLTCAPTRGPPTA
ncbi:MAG TPA: hypothetical protein PLU35_04335 [Phycisphaerales bacterium]|nr:hypothetical protein [Phycisphaerales bacterium]